MNQLTATPISSNQSLAGLAGAGGGLLSFFVGEMVHALINNPDTLDSRPNALELVLYSALWSSAIGLTLGAAILVSENIGSLRGQWHRDLLRGLPLFAALSFGGGVAGQLAFQGSQTSTARGIGWALVGASVGVGIGILRRDPAQAARGALGGAIGGFLGGFIFDGLAIISQILAPDVGNGEFSRLVGLILMGALIALLMRVVQNAFKSAWLLGVSTGPYEGKEYPLNTPRVTVGREDSNAIALFREREIAAEIGALVFQQSAWKWQGVPILINGTPQTDAFLSSGDTLQMGETRFRFYDRSAKNSRSTLASAPTAPHSSPAAYPVPAPRTGAPPAPPRPVAPPSPYVPPPAFALAAPDGALLLLPDLASPVSVGRAAGNPLVLDHAGVSSQHARFHFEAGALYLTDLSSTNGTSLNGVKIAPQTPQVVRIGDRVRFGVLEFTLHAA